MKRQAASGRAPRLQTSSYEYEIKGYCPTGCLQWRVALKDSTSGWLRCPLPEPAKAHHLGEGDVQVYETQTAHSAAKVCVAPIPAVQHRPKKVGVPHFPHPLREPPATPH